MSNLFDISMVFENIPEILTYLPITMELAIGAMAASLVLALLLALVKVHRVPVLYQIVNVFISIIRGTPVLVQLYVTYFGIPMFLKYLAYKNGTEYNANAVPAILYAFVALAVNESAYNAETIRAAIQSVSKGQIEAAVSLGMTGLQTLWRITLPEALTVALPNLGNSFISLIKGTSLAFVCAVVDMTAAGKIIGGRSYRYFEVYVSLALIYWVITIIVEQAVRLLERRLSIPDQVDVVSAAPAKQAPAEAIIAEEHL